MKRIDPNGTITDVPNGTFKLAKETIKGYIETVPCTDGSLLLIDEEGKMKNLEPNPVATNLVELFPGDYISGIAFVLAPDEIDRIMN